MWVTVGVAGALNRSLWGGQHCSAACHHVGTCQSWEDVGVCRRWSVYIHNLCQCWHPLLGGGGVNHSWSILKLRSRIHPPFSVYLWVSVGVCLCVSVSLCVSISLHACVRRCACVVREWCLCMSVSLGVCVCVCLCLCVPVSLRACVRVTRTHDQTKAEQEKPVFRLRQSLKDESFNLCIFYISWCYHAYLHISFCRNVTVDLQWNCDITAFTSASSAAVYLWFVWCSLLGSPGCWQSHPWWSEDTWSWLLTAALAAKLCRSNDLLVEQLHCCCHHRPAQGKLACIYSGQVRAAKTFICLSGLVCLVCLSVFGLPFWSVRPSVPSLRSVCLRLSDDGDDDDDKDVMISATIVSRAHASAHTVMHIQAGVNLPAWMYMTGGVCARLLACV